LGGLITHISSAISQKNNPQLHYSENLYIVKSCEPEDSIQCTSFCHACVSKHDATQYVDVTHSDEGGGMKLRSVFTSRWLLLLGRLLVPSAPVPDLLSIPLGIPCLRVNAVKETNSLLRPLHERTYIVSK
jgi:hypothetical protein